MGEDDERSVADLLVDQVEIADLILISKCDLAGAKGRSFNRYPENSQHSRENRPNFPCSGKSMKYLIRMFDLPGRNRHRLLKEMRGEICPRD